VALHPEMGMAMVSSIAPADTEPKSAEGQRFWRGEYDEDGNEVSPAYVSGDGTRIVNIPPGPAGRDLRREALEKGWVVDRPFEDRAADAHNAYLVARSKVISLMWTMETGRDYGSDSATRVSDGQVESGVKKSLRDRTFTVGDNVRFWADKLGLSIPSETMTYQTFRELVEGWKRESAPAPFDFEAVLDRTPGKQMLTDDWGAEQLESIRTADKLLRQNEIEGFDEWPDETRAAVREIMSEAYNRGLFTREEYDRNWRGYFGELDFKPPTPPKVEDLVLKVDATPNQLSVVDGDGINIHLEDGDLPVRIIGLLAPDDGQPGYEEAADNLARVLANANTVTFGVYDPETFGTTQLQGNNRKRVLMFVYVDGKPLFDQSVFTAESPTGSQGQPRVSDLEAILGK